MFLLRTILPVESITVKLIAISSKPLAKEITHNKNHFLKILTFLFLIYNTFAHEGQKNLSIDGNR